MLWELKERSQRDGSFELTKHMLKLWIIKYLQFYAEFFGFYLNLNTSILHSKGL